MTVDRVVLLCEDSRQRDFFNALAKQLDLEIVSNVVSPRGRGAASAWVVAKYPDEVRSLRAKRHQQGLALCVIVDGDNQGLRRRTAELDAALDAAGLQRRGAEDRIALLVPTWSIETWMLWLVGRAVDETQTYKRAPEVDDVRPRAAAERWRRWGERSAAEQAMVPSLREARLELEHFAER